MAGVMPTDPTMPTTSSSSNVDATAPPSSEEHDVDMCRVCRTESSPNRPLFYPCVCTGSIKYIHQECLLEWLKYSKKEYCELCKHKYTFQPIYHPDMPAHLPMLECVSGLGRQVGRAVKCWLIYTFVACAWLGVVPLTACRIYRAIFQGSLPALLTLPFDLFSLEHIATDILQGVSILAVFLCSFIWLVWLSEQITHGAPHHELDLDDEAVPDDVDLHHEPAEEDVPEEGAPATEENTSAPSEVSTERPSTSSSVLTPSSMPGPSIANASEDLPSTSAPPSVPTDTPGWTDYRTPPTYSTESSDSENESVVDDAAPDEQPAAGEEAAADDDGANVNDDANWFDNWERRGEELSWERLLGFDGSFAFLEHIFWVISFNTLFTVTFAFIPYHVGMTMARACRATWLLSASRFGGAISALIGYVCVCLCVYMMHALARVCRFRRLHKATGTCYLMIKVFLLVMAEAGLFPLMCGWWLDVCSLNLFSATLQQRKASFAHAPGISTFVHWLLGMLYVFYCASFVLVLRDVLRPGTLWFLRNLNDPNFNPIQEMLTLPVRRHLRRLLASLVLFMVTIMLVVYIPVKLIRFAIPNLLPYNITPTRETPMGELSLELLLLQVIVPALLEQSQARQAAKALIRLWCRHVGGWLDLSSYLLGEPKSEENTAAQDGDAPVLAIENPGVDAVDQQVIAVVDPVDDGAPPVPPRPAVVEADANNLAAEHHALLLRGEPTTHAHYASPTYFALRICVLLLSLSLTTIVWSTTALCLPVALGRLVIALLGGGDAQVHELYTVSTGLYVCYVVGHGTAHTYRWLAQEWEAIRAATINALVVFGKCTIACLGLLVLLPLLMGIAFQLVLFTPLRVNANQSPLYFPIQDWAMGVLHFKVLCAMVTMGPDWWLKAVFERLYNDGVRELDLAFLYRECVWPLASAIMLFITAPYVAAFGIAPMLGVPTEACIALQRNLYMCIVFFVSLTAFLVWQAKRIGRLVLRIRDEKYLLGQRLMNYEREMAKREEETEQLSIEAPVEVE